MPGLCGVVDANSHGRSSIDSAIAHLCRYPWHHPAVESFDRGTAGHVAVEYAGLAPVSAFARAAHIRVVFDGELYGNDALAPAECVARGVVARGRAYFKSVHGSFTCAIWDERAETMSLVTDRYGTRPLFWAADRGRFSFASEVGAVAAVRPRSERSLAGSAEFLAFGQLLGDTTLYEGIQAAPGAAWITFDARREQLTVDRYESLDAQGAERTEGEWLQEIDEALAASVEQCCLTDGSLGLSLSGGLDARTILAVAPRDVRMTCVSLGIPGSIDLRAARRMADLAGQPFHQHHLDKDFLGRFEPLLREMVDLTDGHYLDQGIVLTTLSSYRDLGIRTLLRGHAGELMHMSKAYAFSMDAPATRLASKESLLDWLWRHLSDYMLGSVDPSFFTGPFGSTLRDRARASLERQASAWDDVDPVPQRMWRIFLAERVRRETALSLHVFRSFVEVRLPYLEPRLVSLLLGAPVALKIDDVIQHHIVRSRRPAFLGIVNANTGAAMGASRVTRQLASFKMRAFAKLGVPGYQPYERLGLWLAQDLQPLLRRTLLADAVLGVTGLEKQAVAALIDQHARRERNHTFLLMALLILGLEHVEDARSSAGSATGAAVSRSVPA